MLIIDLDSNYLCQSQGDESKILPKKLQKALAAALKGDAGKNLVFIQMYGAKYFCKKKLTKVDGFNLRYGWIKGNDGIRSISSFVCGDNRSLHRVHLYTARWEIRV